MTRPPALSIVLAAAMATPALANVNVRGYAEYCNPPSGANDFHIDYHSNMGNFTADPRARDNAGGSYAAGSTWTQTTSGGDGNSNHASTAFVRPPNDNRPFSCLAVSIVISGPTLCDMRVDDKYWTRNGVRMDKKVAGPGIDVHNDDGSGNTTLSFTNDHDDVTMRLSGISLDIFTPDSVPQFDAEFSSEGDYTYSMPDFVLEPHTLMTFTFPGMAQNGDWTSARASIEVWNPDTDTFEMEGGWRIQHETVTPAPTTAMGLLLSGCVLSRRRRTRA